MPDVLIAGEALVEIMRPGKDLPLDVPGPFEGPFPSGAPAIAADAVARLGRSVGFIGAVGDDDFGRCIARKLRSDGVDTAYLQTVPATTAMAFVTYFSDGSRRFLFHLRGSAAERLRGDVVPDAFLSGARYLHLSGSTLATSPEVAAQCLMLIDRVLAAGGRLSFDPNFRPELLPVAEARAAFAPFVERASILLPSGPEACWLAAEDDPEAACRWLLGRGPELVVLKRGSRGCAAFTREGVVESAGLVVDEVDPTGAGDCFAAALLVGLLEGRGIEEAARLASIAGAMAVARRGPMEGSPTRQELDDALVRAGAETLEARRRGS